ncbi:BTAD domain-containing putative transcriptional regulator [Micromonospora sp. NPDC049460]|uniref:BTAD domain-containing putative transcriptional regulator n=1 Tax=Micromonospora sp. NPDC049460 TaxID=3364272 RepID=UPI0037A785D1
MRWPRKVASQLFIVLLIAVPPVALVRLIGWPLTGWPSMRQAREWVAQPLTKDTLAAALTLLAWLIWLFLAGTVTVRIATRLWGRACWLRRVSLPTPLQATATGMAGAAAFGVGTTATTSALPDHPLALTTATLDNQGDTDRSDSPEPVHARAIDGVSVPGGWLPHDVAEQIVAAGALVWLRRRRAYQPSPPHPPDHAWAGDLAPLPATVTAVHVALTTDQPGPPTGTASAGPALTAAAPEPLAALPAGGVGLTGPGALAAGRGALVTVLLAGLRHPPGTARLVITRSALRMLLGAADPATLDLPGMRVVATLSEAATFLNGSAQHPAWPALSEAPAQHGHTSLTGSPISPVLIVDPVDAAAPDGPAITLADAGNTVVVLGALPAGVTWQVDTAGNTHDPSRPSTTGPRLCVLDPVAALDLLTVIGQAQPPTTPPPARTAEAPLQAPRPRIPRQAGGNDTNTNTRAPTPVPVARRLNLRILGRPVLLADGEPLDIRRSAALQALAFLAVHSDGASSRQLTSAIWPGPPAHTLTGRLYTTLSDLRSTVRAACGLNLIDHTDDRYRLNEAHVDVDLWRFQDVCRHAATAVTDHSTSWQTIVDSYPGELAHGHSWPWIEPPREAIRRQVVDACAALASTTTDPQQALKLLQAGIHVDPYNEDLQRRAIGILTALGDHNAAARLRDTYTGRLALAGLRPIDSLHQIPHASSGSVSL